MLLNRWQVSLTAIAATLFCAGAEASGKVRLDPARLLPIVSNSPALAPFQHVRFCLKYPEDCKSGSGAAELLELNADLIGALERINSRVNSSIAPRVKDFAANIDERWTIDPATGDCNDYAVTKRHLLLESNIPPGALRLSVVRTAGNIGHLVLVVSTRSGDLVLDNLTDRILPWQRAHFSWIVIQSASDPRQWEKVKLRNDSAERPDTGRREFAGR